MTNTQKTTSDDCSFGKTPLTAKEELLFRWKLSELLRYLEGHAIALGHLDSISHGLMKPLLSQWIKGGRPDIDWHENAEFLEYRKSHYETLPTS